MKRFTWILALWAGSLAAALPELEQLLNQPLKKVPDTISISGRFEQHSASSPGPVYIITSEQISALQLTNLSEVLRLFPGLHVMQDSHLSYVVSRGIGQPGDFNSRLLFLIDGARINENTQGAGLLGEEFFLDANLIDRVEYQPGASAASHGANAMLGVVHIITKKAADLQGIRLIASSSNQGQHKVQLIASSPSSADFEGWLSASYLQNEYVPLFIADEGLLPWPRSFDDERVHKINSTLQWRTTSLLINGVQRRRLSPGSQSFEGSAPQIIEDKNKNYMLSLRHDQYMGTDLAAYFTLSTFQSKFTRSVPFTLADAFVVQQETELSGRWSAFDARLQWQPSASFSWRSGVDALRDHHQTDAIALPAFDFTQRLQGQNLQLGLFTEGQWRLTSSLAVHVGIRYDRDNFQLSHFSPQAALIWDPLSNLTLKVRHGRSGRAASFMERIYNDGLDIVQPKTEFMQSTDIHIEYKVNDSLQVFSNFYRAKLQDLIFEVLPEGYFTNAMPVQSKGVEAGFDFRWQAISWQIAASAQRSELVDFFRLNNSATRLIKSQVQWHLSNEWQLHWQVFGVSKRRYNEFRVPGYLIQQVGLQWKPTERLSASAVIKNPTQQQAYEIPGQYFDRFQQQPRMVSIQVQWRFW